VTSFHVLVSACLEIRMIAGFPSITTARIDTITARSNALGCTRPARRLRRSPQPSADPAVGLRPDESLHPQPEAQAQTASTRSIPKQRLRPCRLRHIPCQRGAPGRIRACDQQIRRWTDPVLTPGIAELSPTSVHSLCTLATSVQPPVGYSGCAAAGASYSSCRAGIGCVATAGIVRPGGDYGRQPWAAGSVKRE
jgi:hypothetical protein